MSDDEWEDLEKDWETLRPKSSVQLPARPSDLEGQLEEAALKAEFEFKGMAQRYTGETLTTDLLCTLMVTAVKIFMTKWHEGLRGQNLAGLIEFVLEGQDLSPTEMKGFLKALPTSFLDRVLSSAVGSWTSNGVHALVALEHHVRSRNLKDYTLGKDFDRTYAEFDSPEGKIRVFLDELFSGVSPA